MQTSKKFNINKFNLFLEIALVLIFVVEMAEHFSGTHLHELIGLLLTAMLVVHIAFHWSWVTGVSRQFFHKLLSVNKARLKYILNLFLFIDMTLCIVTGILISRTLGLNFAFAQGPGMPFHSLHVLSAQMAFILVGLHIASSWEWLAFNIRKYLLNFSFLQKSSTAEDHTRDNEELLKAKLPASH